MKHLCLPGNKCISLELTPALLKTQGQKMHVLFQIRQRAIYLLRPWRPGADEALSSLAQVSFQLQRSGIKISHTGDDYRQRFVIKISFVSIMHRRSLMISNLPDFQFTSIGKLLMMSRTSVFLHVICQGYDM